MPPVRIESLAYGGDGVAHLPDGRVVFVPGSCPGDLVVVQETEDHGRWVRARTFSLEEPSPDRVDPPCPYVGACGGCQWQHVSYGTQLAAKAKAVVDALERIGDIAPGVVRPIVPSKDTFGYRNKVELVGDASAPRFELGFHRLDSHDIVPIDRCLLLPDRAAAAPRALTGALRYLSGRHGDLGIKRVGIRVAARGTDLQVALWTSPGAFPRHAVANTLADAVGANSVVRVLLRNDARRSIAGTEVLSGAGAWRERLAGFGFGVSAPSFFQVNTATAERLVEIALEALDPGPEDRVADVYAGVGAFTLPLADRTGEVVAIEGSSAAIADLRRNLGRARLDADIIGGAAERELPAAGAFDHAVVDPPRQGLTADALDALVGTHARTLAYISCDPATLARDCRRLVDRGYAIRHVTPVDLFPHTFHVETITVLERG